MNNTGPVVRKRRHVDRRVERTTRALGAALIELMLERPFDDITVQDVLDRAEVGRSTFYAHFRNKRDLFLSDYERFLLGLEHWLDRDAPHQRRLAPVAEFFQHISDAQRLLRALREAGQLELVWDLAAAQFARMIERRFQLFGERRLRLPAAASARFCAGALIETLKWWLDRDARPSPREMDEAYHAMIWKALAHP